MVKQYVNYELVEVKDGDKVIRVAEFTIYDGSLLICKVDDDFIQFQKNVQENVNRKFYALPEEDRVQIMKGLADKAGSLVITVIKDMLQSDYDKECCYTPGSVLFMEPKKI